MHKNYKLKYSREYLKSDFPENILPYKKLSKKDKRLFQEKVLYLRKIKNRIKKLEKYLQIKAKQGQLKTIYPSPISSSFNHTALDEKQNKKTKNQNLSFLFSSDQLKYDLLRKQNQTRGFSDYLMKIKEKKKFSILYGKISKKFFQKAYNQAHKVQGRFNENLLIQFETRLDVVLYRICFFNTIASAKQSISHSLVLVNGVIVNIPSYQVKPGDIISLDKKKKELMVKRLVNFLKEKLPRRRFRFLISTKFLKKRFGFPSYEVRSKGFPLSSNSKTIHTLKMYQKSRVDSTTMYQNSTKKLLSVLKQCLISLMKRKNWSIKGKSRIPKNTKRLWLLEGLVRANVLLKVSRDKLASLKIKKLMYRKPSRQARLSAMTISPIKPLNIEISYRLLCAIILFSPQKLVFPAMVNVDLLSRSIANN